ncbi:MAG: DUF933 domain-containing protein [Syntrophales bacterium]|nr:DUF933 domain-containing protein [Syntrophales bacterium]
MKIGLIGLAASGKTTVFQALTALDSGAALRRGKKSDNIAVVEVRDERVSRLSTMYNPARTTYATIEIVDFAGAERNGANKSEIYRPPSAITGNIDALAVVLGNFSGAQGEPDPVGDLKKIEAEMLLGDMVIAENRLERIRDGYKRGRNGNGTEREDALLRRIVSEMNDGRPIRALELDCEEKKIIRVFQFLTMKPLMAVLNSEETRFGKNSVMLKEIAGACEAIEFAGRFEMELSHMQEEEARDFMNDMGIGKSACDRLAEIAYRTVNYISFYTVGSDEVRAWPLRRGMTAVEAAGTIHSDLARGFIRAECFSYDDLVECGSEKKIRERGRFRLEGKNYIVRDRDILSIRSGL